MNTDIITYGYQPKTLAGPAGEAQKVLRKLWAHRDEWFYEDVTPEEIVRNAPLVAAEKLLGLKVEFVDQIPSDTIGFTVAGYLDRPRRRIVISRDQPPEVQRFTLAHELGHALMHRGEIIHRDRPSDGSRRKGSDVPSIEYEADTFAANLLMPEDFLRKVFESCFGGRIVAREADDNFSYWITGAIGRRVPPSEIARWKPYELAIAIARMEEFGTNMFVSLKDQFAVSPSAMATRLCRLGLVS